MREGFIRRYSGMNPDASSGEAKDIGIHGMNAGIWKESRERAELVSETSTSVRRQEALRLSRSPRRGFYERNEQHFLSRRIIARASMCKETPNLRRILLTLS